MKQLNTERLVTIISNCPSLIFATRHSERDLKSHGMRSRLLSLQLVLTVLNSHMPLFVDPSAIIYSSSTHEATTFVQAINQYLCLCLSRNAVSSVPQVFEISVEIFWRVLAGMRTKLKVSYSVFQSQGVEGLHLVERN